jgi:SAM-dependent methyltransferase
MYYAALDIAKGYRTTILDLNHRSLPVRFRRRFDVVINSGTTEHLLNQYNAFKVMHDALRAGGYVVHSLPCRGFSNHGYLTYTPRFFFDLASYNKYDVVSMWLSEGTNDDLYAPIRDYSSYFPNVVDVSADPSVRPAADVSITIILRKTSNTRFIAPMEQSTSVGFIPTAFSLRKLAHLARRALR